MTEAADKSSSVRISHNIAATTPPKAVCKDDTVECASWAGEGFCVGKYAGNLVDSRRRLSKKTLEKICRKSCGFCTEDEASSSEVVHSAAIAWLCVCVYLRLLCYLCICASACVPVCVRLPLSVSRPLTASASHCLCLCLSLPLSFRKPRKGEQPSRRRRRKRE